MKLSIIIPAHNEEKRIKRTLTSYATYFGPKLRKNYEIIVVCDDCKDRTSQIVRNFSRRHKNVKCLDPRKKVGKGGAILIGFKAAKGNIVGFVDADDAFEIGGIKKLIDFADSEYDCAIASKWKGRSFFQVTEPFFRKVLSRVWNIILRVLFDLKISDTQAGAKFLKRGILASLPQFYCTGFEFDDELLWRISQSGFSIKEVYIPTIHKEGSKFKMIRSINMLINILKLRLNV